MRVPKISVLLPAYNHAQYLSETIESVLNQTYSDFELLISDDCSTDDTAQVIKSYTDGRITGVYFEKNQGTVRALNYLLRMAKGEYIAVLGSDDVWESDKLEKQIAVLEHDRSLAACFSGATIIDGNSEVINDEAVFPLNIFNYENRDKAFWLREIYLSGNHFCHSSVLIRSDIHHQIGEYNIAYRQLHDMDLWVRLLLQYNVFVLDEPLVKYRFVTNANNVSRNTEINNFRLYNEAEEVITFLFENISDCDFKNGFKELFESNNVVSKAQIVCEKFLLLKKVKLWAADNTSLAINFLLRHLNFEVVQCFENEYGILLNDIYDHTSNYKATYYAEVYYELKKLQEDYSGLMLQNAMLEKQSQHQEEQCRYHEEQCRNQQEQNIILQETIKEIYSSNSWKITKPLRLLTRMLKRNSAGEEPNNLR